MSRDDWFWRDYRPAPRKLPPPAHGIKVGRIGATWWGQRWVGALERLGGGYGARLGRGRSYARQGRVHDLRVGHGAVTALVTGSRPAPYEVSLRLSRLDAGAWGRAIRAMAAKARFAAALLAGDMPREIDQAFAEAGASLFPSRAGDLATACSCPDWGKPCKHVAAVHYVLGAAFDRDPFLLFELRGRGKAAVLDALRRLRAGPPARARRGAGHAARPATVRVAALGRESYDALRESLDGMRFHIGEPAAPGAVLRQLGTPPSWRVDSTPHELLRATVSRAAALAREIALRAQP